MSVLTYQDAVAKISELVENIKEAYRQANELSDKFDIPFGIDLGGSYVTHDWDGSMEWQPSNDDEWQSSSC
ncbi:hypothetical protein [Ralstonia phage RSP15]|uniref:hypothetical protein n=1 Tax=Ralstonia phage RSP15 TaxID=1785960 RepID=UPI00074D2D2D|nr:hypothetical protein BH754_gp192 [Ralstonia phage RSP15]BAU40114.1 hypothetical protein [Ralstonia phage RSP15]